MTPGEVVVLGLLYEQERYGYEIEEIIKQRQIREWAEIGFSSIYSILNKLEKAGWVESRYDKAFGSPKRRVYSLKDDAKSALLDEIRRMLSSPHRVFSEFDVGMAYSYLLEKQEVIQCLSAYKKNLSERQAYLQAENQNHKEARSHKHVKVLFTRPLCMIKAESRWLDDLIHEIKE